MAEEIKEKSKKKGKAGHNVSVEEMAEAGLHFGHQTSRVHPKMTPYIYGIRNATHIIDLDKTKEKFEEALLFIRNLVAEGKVLLIVGTKIQTKLVTEEIAKSCGLPYVSERWLGGTITNFGIIKKRIDYFKDLEKKKNEGQLEKYTKKERILIDRELKVLEKKFIGIKNLEKTPDAIFVVNTKKDDTAVKEARMKGIKVIAIVDTNINPNVADYPIPANDESVESVRYILNAVTAAAVSAKPKVEQK